MGDDATEIVVVQETAPSGNTGTSSSFPFSINPWIVIAVAAAILILWYLYGSKLRFWKKETPVTGVPNQDPRQAQMMQMLQEQQLAQEMAAAEHHMAHEQQMMLQEQLRHRMRQMQKAGSSAKPKKRAKSVEESDDDETPVFPRAIPLGGLVEIIAVNNNKPGKAKVEELQDDPEDASNGAGQDPDDPDDDDESENEAETPATVKVNKPRKRRTKADA